MHQDPSVFYGAVAGLLPVLLLALVLEGRLLGRPSRRLSVLIRAIHYAMVFGFCVFAVAGEALSLHVLLSGHPTEFLRTVTLVSVIQAGAVLMLAILTATANEVDPPDWLHWGAIGAVFVAQVVGTVLVAVA